MDVVIEVPMSSKVKYEYDESFNCIRLDRILHNSNTFPYNYGFIPNTLSPDGDPIDIFVICEHRLIPGCRVKVNVLGGIETTDEKGLDHKLISVVCKDPDFMHYKDIDELPTAYTHKIMYFLKHYKDGEPGKFINVDNKFYDKEHALKLIKLYTNSS